MSGQLQDRMGGSRAYLAARVVEVELDALSQLVRRVIDVASEVAHVNAVNAISTLLVHNQYKSGNPQ